jgi:hypothetical protein
MTYHAPAVRNRAGQDRYTSPANPRRHKFSRLDGGTSNPNVASSQPFTDHGSARNRCPICHVRFRSELALEIHQQKAKQPRIFDAVESHREMYIRMGLLRPAAPDSSTPAGELAGDLDMTAGEAQA